jgi:inosine/xanthosine triphosphate pyrophosphatase family protein
MLHRIKAKLRTTDFTKYYVRYTDHKGRHEEEYVLASDAMFRFRQLENFPGIRDLSWSTARGYVFASAKPSQGNLL